MITMQELLSTLPQRGQLTWIGLRPGRKQNMLSVNEGDVSTETGLAGDRYQGRSLTRQITLLQAEHLPVIASCIGGSSGRSKGKTEVTPELLRRNFLVSGINLLALKDRPFCIGDVEFLGTGLCHPCSRMETLLGPGGYNAMRGHGGITAQVISNGTIRIGDALTLAVK